MVEGRIFKTKEGAFHDVFLGIQALDWLLWTCGHVF